MVNFFNYSFGGRDLKMPGEPHFRGIEIKVEDRKALQTMTMTYENEQKQFL